MRKARRAAAKRAGVERLGGRVELAGITTADRMARAQQLASESGSVLVPPYDDARIVARRVFDWAFRDIPITEIATIVNKKRALICLPSPICLM